MSRSPDSSEGPGVLRMLGVGALGLVGGALLALFIQDLLVVALVRYGNVPAELTVVFIYLIPVVAVVSAPTAVVIDRQLAARRNAKSTDDD